MNFTKHTLKKLEELIEILDYEILYGKGNFQSGYCIVENQKKVVINRYFETEARINSLLDIISQIEVDENLLDEKQLDYLGEVQKVIQERVEAE